LNYSPTTKSLEIAGDWAIEVRRGQCHLPAHIEDTGVRLLKRQDDGSWKFALVGRK
jgi:hypothetical protein